MNVAVSVWYALGMVVVIVGLDVSVFRSADWFWERLAANVGVVLIFVAFYFRFVWRA